MNRSVFTRVLVSLNLAEALPFLALAALVLFAPSMAYALDLKGVATTMTGDGTVKFIVNACIVGAILLTIFKNWERLTSFDWGVVASVLGGVFLLFFWPDLVTMFADMAK